MKHKKKLVTVLTVMGIFLSGVIAGAAVQSNFFEDAQQTMATIDQLFAKGSQYKDKAKQLQEQLDQNKNDSQNLKNQITELQGDIQNKNNDLQTRNAEIQRLQREYETKKQEAIDLNNQLAALGQVDDQKDAKMAEVRKHAEDKLGQLDQ